MFKKIALAAALVATASFATWDKFPVLEQGKGQAAVGINDLMQDKGNQLSLGAKGRFTVIQLVWQSPTSSSLTGMVKTRKPMVSLTLASWFATSSCRP